ncbi:UNVERIFIED_CONTAM: hypothetical protein NCL1_12576 [Trichonephila clavipes]
MITQSDEGGRRKIVSSHILCRISIMLWKATFDIVVHHLPTYTILVRDMHGSGFLATSMAFSHIDNGLFSNNPSIVLMHPVQRRDPIVSQ